jgi:hypothetical protein
MRLHLRTAGIELGLVVGYYEHGTELLFSMNNQEFSDHQRNYLVFRNTPAVWMNELSITLQNSLNV